MRAASVGNRCPGWIAVWTQRIAPDRKRDSSAFDVALEETRLVTIADRAIEFEGSQLKEATVLYFPA
jgi:hypothetical protein